MPVAQSPKPGHHIVMDDLSILRLQMEWGADEALDDSPVDRLRDVTPPPVSAVRVRTAPERTAAPAAPVGTPAERALRAASQAASLDELKAAIVAFPGCPLRDMATHIVFAAGDPEAGLLVIGGAPGAEDDRAGAPFSGPEGALLDQMLASVGLTRQGMLLTPLIPWRPPGGRVPSPAELQLYRPFLMRLIALTAPARVILLGALPAATVLGPGTRPRKIGWTDMKIDGRGTRVLIVPALADVIKTPARRKDAWAGMRALRRALDQ